MNFQNKEQNKVFFCCCKVFNQNKLQTPVTSDVALVLFLIFVFGAYKHIEGIKKEII
jgi:hypothetical protein